MTSFYSAQLNVNTTAQMVVAAVDFDRSLLMRTLSSDLYVGFSATDTHFRLPNGGSASGVTVVLPADEELWAATSTGLATIHILVGGR